MTHCTIVRLLNIDAVDDALLASFSGWLDDSEQLRSVGFIRHERRRQFLAGRILARRALGFILDRAPRDVRLVERPGFAPALVSSGGGNARFSISHSGPWIACAVTTTCGIGLDIEVIDSTRDIAALADQVFDEKQRAWLAARPQQLRARDFYKMWSTLEASIKLGVTPAATFDLSRRELSIIVCCEQEPESPPSLQIDMLEE